MNNSYLYVDMNILRKNVDIILASLQEGQRLIPVLKDDAYGLGLCRVAAVLGEFERVECAAVAHVSEALRLRGGGFKKDILVMGSPLPFQLAAAIMADITLTAGSPDTLSEINDAAAKLGLCAKIHVKIDIGLHRIGLEPGAELAAFIAKLADCGNIRVTGAFSHFSQAENAANCQVEYTRFISATEQLSTAGINVPLRHISCSAASELYPAYSLDALRLGRRLYMDAPRVGDGKIKELASWRSYITALKPRKAGDSIGYGGRFHLERDTLVATVGVGYGDGLNPALCNIHAPVLVSGKRCPLLACCMDQCLVDVSGLDCKVGDEVTFFGCDGDGNYLSSQEIALMIGGDEGCGLTSALSQRVARIYSE